MNICKIKTNAVRKFADGALLFAFVVLLGLPTLDYFLHLDKAPPLNEKRKLAEFPAMTWSQEGARKFITGLENYYADHFGFRTQLIRWEHAWKRDLFHESSFPDVMLGRDGWLFFSNDQMTQNKWGTALFEPSRLKEWQALLESRRDWLAQRGIHFIFVIAPEKHRIYPEYMPDGIISPDAVTRLEQFVAYMKANSTVEILDLRPAVLQAKSIRQTYFRTDTHWNQFGAFVGYQELVRTLGRHFPALEPLPIKAFSVTNRNEPAGNLAVMLGEENSAPERDCPAFAPLPPLTALKTTTEPKLLGKRWNQGMEPVITENPNQTLKAVVFRDSFSIAWIPFLGQNFNRVVYLWQHEFEHEFIEQEKPDVVIEEVVDRLFQVMEPGRLLAMDGGKQE